MFLFNTSQSYNAAIAAFSYPRFKKRWLNSVDPNLHDLLLSKFKEIVISETPDDEEGNSEIPSAILEEDSFFDFGDSSEQPNQQTNTSKMAEIRTYFEDSSRELRQLENSSRAFIFICYYDKFTKV
ncbi:hypothetical protein ABEB36_015317 [Hypothenemus hampei]|uniref:Uncharacterized protein n=1 Tax=Hypothenemus hampei TaxID=57062 RepID=A0ABD1E060_HYPHA